MASGKAVQNRVSKLLKRFQATSRTVTLRQSFTTGGNSVLGIGGTVSYTEIDVDPQPTVTVLDAETIANSGGLYQLGDYELLFSGSLDETVLRNVFIVYGDELLKVLKIEPVVLGGVVIVWRVTARTVKAGT